jgi:hypothetical protein
MRRTSFQTQCSRKSHAPGYQVARNGLPAAMPLKKSLISLVAGFGRPMLYKQDLRPAQQEEEAGLAQGKLRRQLRTGRALLALGLSGLRRQQSGTGYCEMLNDRLQFSWCSMCPRLGTARSGADARRLSSPRTLRCVAGSVSPQCGCAVKQSLRTVVPWSTVLICSR